MVKGAKKIVERLLNESPHLRDDDLKLLANVYWQHVSKTMVGTVSPDEMDGIKLFLKELAEGRLPNFESVRRCRQKLQELNPGLRGELYKTRHESQEQVKEDLRNFSDNLFE